MFLKYLSTIKLAAKDILNDSLPLVGISAEHSLGSPRGARLRHEYLDMAFGEASDEVAANAKKEACRKSYSFQITFLVI